MGGTAYFAEPPGGNPNYIFPFAPFRYFSVDNLSQFQMLMYRPLYWFGNGSNPTINLSDSLAKYPTFSNGGKTVTVDLNAYKWSDGETVTSQDVVFWMNFMKLEKDTWAGYVPGTIPDDVASISTPNANDGRLQPHRVGEPVLVGVQRAQPDHAAADGMGCDFAVPEGRRGVLWQGVLWLGRRQVDEDRDRPRQLHREELRQRLRLPVQGSRLRPVQPEGLEQRLRHLRDEQAVAGRRRTVAPHVVQRFGPGHDEAEPLVLRPGEADVVGLHRAALHLGTAEFNELVSGNISVGYIPAEDITVPAPSPTKVGPNNSRVSGKYNLVPWYTWGITYFPLNFNSVDDGGYAGAIYHQLYFRQALQMLIDQPLLIKKIIKGYGVPGYGPVPVLPKNSFVTKFEETNPYPYNPAKAKSILVAHGWTINAGGTDVCAVASECGVPKGTQLNFQMLYSSGNDGHDPDGRGRGFLVVVGRDPRHGDRRDVRRGLRHLAPMLGFDAAPGA